MFSLMKTKYLSKKLRYHHVCSFPGLQYIHNECLPFMDTECINTKAFLEFPELNRSSASPSSREPLSGDLSVQQVFR